MTRTGGHRQCARGQEGGNNFGFQAPPVTLARGYQDLKIQDHILKLHVLQCFSMTEHLLESHTPVPLCRLQGRLISTCKHKMSPNVSLAITSTTKRRATQHENAISCVCNGKANKRPASHIETWENVTRKQDWRRVCCA